VFPAPLMSTIGEIGSFLARESPAATELADGRWLLTDSRMGSRCRHDGEAEAQPRRCGTDETQPSVTPVAGLLLCRAAEVPRREQSRSEP